MINIRDQLVQNSARLEPNLKSIMVSAVQEIDRLRAELAALRKTWHATIRDVAEAAPVPPAASAEVPDGYVLVPKVPTLSMLESGISAMSMNGAEGTDEQIESDVMAAYHAMLAAAQKEGK